MRTSLLIIGLIVSNVSWSISSASSESMRDVRTSGRNPNPDSGMARPQSATISDMKDGASAPVWDISDDVGMSREEYENRKYRSPAAKSTSSATAPQVPEANNSSSPTAGVTAERQSHSEKDLEITRQVRRELMNSSELSTRTQNLTVVTQNGKVSLRGTVPSVSEKNKVEKMARAVNGVEHVDSSQVTVSK